MRLISWNIRAGGGVRAELIAEAIIEKQPDVVALSEFRGTEPSLLIANLLSDAGLSFQRTTIDPKQPAVNSLLVASRWPLRTQNLQRAPDNKHRWLHVNVASPCPLAVMAVHIPNRVTGTKYPFMEAIENVLRLWRGPPAVLMGDTNSGQIDIDEESSAFNKIEDRWITTLGNLDWQDAFRLTNGDKREFTWYSPNGRNGFRLDQMFLHPSISNNVIEFNHHWFGATSERKEVLSDHAAMMIDFLNDSIKRGPHSGPPVR